MTLWALWCSSEDGSQQGWVEGGKELCKKLAQGVAAGLHAVTGDKDHETNNAEDHTDTKSRSGQPLDG